MRVDLRALRRSPWVAFASGRVSRLCASQGPSPILWALRSPLSYAVSARHRRRTPRRVSLNVPAITWLLLSCVVGLGISYTGWKLRELITATTYTLVGVLNKMATIAITALAFPGDTSALGVTMLVLCILFGILYQDAPLRRDDRCVAVVTGPDHPPVINHSPARTCSALLR